MSSTAPYDAVFLDAGGVLVSPDPQRLAARFGDADIQIDPTRLVDAHFRAVVALDEAVAGVDDEYAAYYRAYVRSLDVPEEQVDVAAALLADVWATSNLWTAALPWVAEGLVGLAALDLPIVIVSNADGTVAEVLAAATICQVGPGDGTAVTHVIDSGAVGVAKPDPRIFELALDVVEVPPERAVHIGDSYRYDVAGARAAGVHPVLIDPLGLRPDADCDRVASLVELVDRLA